MELKDAFEGVLAKALNLPVAEISSLYNEEGVLNDDAVDVILNKQTESVQKARDKAKVERDEQYKRGQREKGTEYEKLLKDAGVELGDAKGADAVEILTKHIESKAVPSDLKEDQVKNSELYRKMEKTFQAQLTEKEKLHTDYIAQRDTKEQRDNTLMDVRSKAKGILDSLKPNLPTDPTKAANQVRFLMSDIEGYSFERDEDDYIILDKDGTRVEGLNGHPLKFNDFVKSKAEAIFDFQVSDPKSAAGDVTKGTAKGIKLQKPASRQAYAEQLQTISEDRTMNAAEKLELVSGLKELAKDLT